MVSKARACPGGRYLQRRQQRRRDRRPPHRAGYRHHVGMARGLRCHWRDRLRLARLLARVVSRARAPSLARGARARVYPQRSGGVAAARAVDQPPREARDMGVRRRQGAHRSRLALLFVLAAEVSRRQLGGEAHRVGGATRCDLSDGRRGIGRGWLGVWPAHCPRLADEPCSEDGDADRRAAHPSDGVRSLREQPLDRGESGCRCGRRPPVVVRQPVHHRQR